MLLPPFFLKPGAKYLYEHMKAIANAVKIPIMAQYAPEQTGVAIPPETFCRLEKECPNMIYYKIECKPAGPYVTNLMRLTDNKMKIFVGNAGFQLIECMDRGAIGAMPGCSIYNVYIDIYNNYINGNREKADFLHTTPELFDKICNVDYRGAFFCIQRAAQLMADSKTKGNIILISSNNAVAHFADVSVYASAKSAAEKAARHAAIELAKYGIRVNTIEPGWTDTGAARINSKEETFCI